MIRGTKGEFWLRHRRPPPCRLHNVTNLGKIISLGDELYFFAAQRASFGCATGAHHPNFSAEKVTIFEKEYRKLQ